MEHTLSSMPVHRPRHCTAATARPRYHGRVMPARSSQRLVRLRRGLVTAALVLAGAATIPRAVCGRGAEARWAGERASQGALAAEVAAQVRAGVGAASFSTGSARFDGEWALVTHQMAALGLGQVILAHPDQRDAWLPVIEQCAERLLAPGSTAFGREAWGEDGLAAHGSANGHAYLGYANLALSMLTLLDPGNRFVGLNERLTEALARRTREAPHGIIETYPGEAYPADMAAVVGSIGLYDRARGGGRYREVVRHFAAALRGRYLERGSGMIHQMVDAGAGRPVGPPRASGTAIAAYFLSFADSALAREVFAGIAARQRASLFGFGGVREYPEGVGGGGDIDSGPVLFGVSVSATGFSLAGARLFGEREMFVEIYRTAELFGVEVGGAAGGRRYLSGGPLGNAILLAMMTAGPGAAGGAP